VSNAVETRKTEIRSYVEDCHAQSWAIIERLEAKDENLVVYSSEETDWTLRTLIAHLADAERGMLGQMKRAVAGEMTVPENFDLQRWNRGVARKSSDGSIEDYKLRILNGFQDLLHFLDDLDENSLDVQGRHPSGDLLTMEGYLRRIAKHRLDHARDLQQAMDK
jgi:hypothetical protein